MLGSIFCPVKNIFEVFLWSEFFFKANCTKPQWLLLGHLWNCIEVDGSCSFNGSLLNAGLCILQPYPLILFKLLFLLHVSQPVNKVLHSISHGILNYSPTGNYALPLLGCNCLFKPLFPLDLDGTRQFLNCSINDLGHSGPIALCFLQFGSIYPNRIFGREFFTGFV